MHRVLVTDNLSGAGIARLQETDGLEVVVDHDFKSLSVEEKRAKLAEVDAIIIRSGVKMTPELLDGQERLKLVVRAGVGVDNINQEAATKAGVVVMNTPAGNTVSTAELAVAMMMALSRNLGPAHASMKDGVWDRKAFTGTELAGKTLGIVGVGRIGLTVARIAKGLQMKVVGYDPLFPIERGEEVGVPISRDLNEVLTQADYLTVHTPLNDQTRGMIGAEQLKAMKSTARLINCARGGIIDEHALLDALEAGEVAGAALDVYSQEPPKDDDRLKELVKHPKILATPHLGASTSEAQEAVALEAADITAAYLINNEIRYAINTAPISGSEIKDLGKYLDLSYRLGLLLSQLVKQKGVRSATVNYRGEISGKNTKLLTSTFAVGLLERLLDGSVNVINATVRAEEAGIPLTESKTSEPGDFGSTIHAALQTDDGELHVAGTVFGKGYLRLIRLEEFHLDAFLDGHLLIYRHLDRPGQIGRIGEILGRHQVNIADMSLGRLRDHAGGDSIAVLHLDDTPPQAAVDEIAASDDVTGVDVVALPPASHPLPWHQSAD